MSITSALAPSYKFLDKKLAFWRTQSGGARPTSSESYVTPRNDVGHDIADIRRAPAGVDEISVQCYLLSLLAPEVKAAWARDSYDANPGA